MQFTIIRFLPDIIRDEPVNVGVIATYKDDRFSRLAELKSIPRAMEICWLDQTMLEWWVESWFLDSARTIPELCELSFEGNLQFYQQLGMVTDDPEKAVDEIYDRYVGV